MKMEDLFDNISEWSYQRFARFYGDIKPSDDKFNDKIYKIYNLIINDKMDDIEQIAKESGCSYEECVLKIKYLKNKRKIGNYYIDNVNKLIKECDFKDEELLDKYSNYLYKKHCQIRDIALKMPITSFENIEQMEELIYGDIMYLYNKGLLNGIAINEVDRKIIYYSVEKHKNETDYVTINCPNCGAINDVNRYSKVRCCYCKSIIEDTVSKRN